MEFGRSIIDLLL